MPLDATIGGAQANSYVTVAEADAYFSLRLNSEAWTSAAQGTKEAALVQATTQIDVAVTYLGKPPSPPWPFLSPRDVLPYPYTSVSYISLYPTYPGAGFKSKLDQRLKFPRWWDRDLSTGALLIPQTVKDAVCEQALFLLEQGPDFARRQAVQAQNVRRFKVGTLEEEYNTWAGREIPLSPITKTLMKGFLMKVGILT